MRFRPAVLSSGLHVAIVCGLVSVSGLGVAPIVRPLIMPQHTALLVSPAIWRHEAGGGGQRDLLPASIGRLPPPPQHRVFVPPAAHILNANARLQAEQAMLLDPDLAVQDVAFDRIGDPMGVDGPLSGGRGGPTGIGDGRGGGVGDLVGKGYRIGGGGTQVARKHGRITEPKVIYRVEPEYSDEARRAKIQGMVVLAGEVGTNGRLGDVHVLHALGLGLDERAKEAAELWRFQPAMSDGRPVAVTVRVFVTFRLL